MRFYPTRIPNIFFCFILSFLVLTFSCSKDSDLLADSVIDNTVATIEEKEQSTDTESTSETDEQSSEEETQDDVIESRTISFTPTNDAHVQSGKGYNQNIIRLEEGLRTSYLMFDLNPINDVGGTLTSASLQFTISQDDGSGTIIVHKGNSNDWTEDNLSESTLPEIDVELGNLVKEYNVGVTEIIELDITSLALENATLILEHKNGNDLAFASKEHASKIGPKLVVSYDVPDGAEEIDQTEDPISEGEEDGQEENTEDSENPMAIADASLSSGGVPLEVTFTGENSTDNVEIVNYVWDFKDGSSSTDANPTHTFAEIGVYEVTLTVTDSDGLSDTDIVTITVNEEQNETPKAIISATPVSGEAPLEVVLKGSDSTDDTSISTYSWDYGDGQKGNAADPTHTYTEAGTYVAELTVKDENGLEDKETVTITVTESENESPVAVISANPKSGAAPLDVQFNGNGSSDDKEIESFLWDFKDGSTATNTNPSHKFTNAGTYQVELTVKDMEGLSNKETITITVTEPENQSPVAIVSANPKSGEAPLNVQFIGNQSTDDNGINSYFWDFKDGSTATSSNPSHTFNDPGNYVVELTVSDSEGLQNSKSVTITVEDPGGNSGGNVPPGFYVATNGKSSNSGKSPSSPWSLEHAFYIAEPGNTIYVKSGNYGAKMLVTRNGGSSGNPIKFIGYETSPGDISSSNGPTFSSGESVSSSKMPLLTTNDPNAIAFHIQDRYIHVENFQISGYGRGLIAGENATNLVAKNLIVVDAGNQNSSSAYDGYGINIKGNNSLIENCFIRNATAQAITLSNSDNSKVRYCEVFATNSTNPTDYYYILSGGTTNSLVENSLADRANGLSHGGHGFNVKDDGSYNTFKNCTAKKTSFEFTFSGAHHNTIDGGAIYGVNTSSSNWEARMAIIGGSHHNTIKNLKIEDTWAAISMTTFNGDESSIGNDNLFENVTVKNTNRVLGMGGGTNYNSKAKNYTFKNCDFTNFESVAVVYYGGENFKFSNCTFQNGEKFVVEIGGAYAPYSNLDVTWSNCTWSNVNFNPPN